VGKQENYKNRQFWLHHKIDFFILALLVLVNNPKISLKNTISIPWTKEGGGRGKPILFFSKRKKPFWTVTNKGQHTRSQK
jgi:hypothetical protein